jgi:rubrerythrin
MVKQVQRRNRTGITVSPELSEEMIARAQETVPSSPGSAKEIAVMRAVAIAEAEPAGSVPEPEGSAVALPPILIDKLGDRLAFERNGTRLYEVLINKVQSAGKRASSPSIRDLEHIRDEELHHFTLLKQAIEQLGGDPTFLTPAANVSGVVSSGIVQVLTDPRTTVDQCLDAILVAELADNDGWQMLGDLATAAGQEDLAQECRRALEEEGEHLEKVRGWLKERAAAQVGGAPKRKAT